MVVIGFDTAIAFELEIASQQKTLPYETNRCSSRRQSYSRPGSQHAGITRPHSAVGISHRYVQSDKFRPSSVQNNRHKSCTSDFQSKMSADLSSGSGHVTPSELSPSDLEISRTHNSTSEITDFRSTCTDTPDSRLNETMLKELMCSEISRSNSDISRSPSFQDTPSYSDMTRTRPHTSLSGIRSDLNGSLFKRRPKTCVPKSQRQYNGHMTRSGTSNQRSRPLGQSNNSLDIPKFCDETDSLSLEITSNQYPQDGGHIQYVPKGPIEGDSTGLMGSSVNYIGSQPRATWSMADSQIGLHNPTMGNVNTPRILELDINRMMIGQNTISAQIGSPGLSNDRLVNAANNNLRSYMTVNRPGPNSAGKNDRPSSGSRQSPHSSSSPTNHSASTAKRVRLSDVEIPTVMSASQPLPPIGLTDRPGSSSSKGRQSPARIPVGNDLPESPPGSSLRQSPVEDSEVVSPTK